MSKDISSERKPLAWIGSALEDLKAFPIPIRKDMGVALDLAQQGGKHPDAKPLKGFGGASTLEVVANYDGNTYRGVYTVKFAERIYVLHAFQKKSKYGSSTPKAEIELVKDRLKVAQQSHDEWVKSHTENRNGK